MGGRVTTTTTAGNPAVESISLSIALLRGQRVILDADLAALYEVPTKRFNEAVKRNAARFPADFMLQLTAEEAESLRSQFATLKTGRGQHRKYLPYAFTEHGAIMAATVLNSPRAVQVALYVVRAFVRLSDSLRWKRRPIIWPRSTRFSAATRVFSCVSCFMRCASSLRSPRQSNDPSGS